MNFKSIKYDHRSGIYCILNKINGKFYIGSTIDFWSRYKEHFNSLKRNDHHSIHLQRSFNKRGLENFQFHILEVLDSIDKIYIRSVEQKYLDFLQPYNIHIGYNISRKALGIDVPVDKQRYRELLGKKIVAYNLDGTFFKKFISTTEATEILNLTGGGISANLSYRSHRCGRWMFKYVDDSGEYLETIAPYKYSLIGKKRDVSIGPKIVATRKKNGSYGHSEEQKEKFRQLKLGAKSSEETKLKQSIAMKGKKFSVEHRANNDASRCKSILVYNWLGDVINNFESLKAAAINFGINSATLCPYVKEGRPYKDNYLVYLNKKKLEPVSTI